MTHLVGIIMPLFNKGKYVKRAVESVLTQTYSRWELIIVDDGSTDNSVDEIPMGDPRIKLFRNKNLGPAAARNFGATQTSADILCFLDADDYFYIDKIEHDVGLFNQYPAISWHVACFDHEINASISKIHIKDKNGNIITGTPKLFLDAVQQLQLSGWHINGVCIRKDIFFSKLKGFDENFRCYEITDFVYRCALEIPNVLISPYATSRVIDVPDSAFKITEDRIDGIGQLSKRFHILSIKYPAYAPILNILSFNYAKSYVYALIFSSRKLSAINFLLNQFPFKKNISWLKLLLLSCQPDYILSQLKAFHHKSDKQQAT